MDCAVTRQIVQHTKKKRVITKARKDESTKGIGHIGPVARGKETHQFEQLTDIHFAQLRSYLKAAGLKVGLLLNFANPTLEIRRVVN